MSFWRGDTSLGQSGDWIDMHRVRIEALGALLAISAEFLEAGVNNSGCCAEGVC